MTPTDDECGAWRCTAQSRAVSVERDSNRQRAWLASVSSFQVGNGSDSRRIPNVFAGAERGSNRWRMGGAWLPCMSGHTHRIPSGRRHTPGMARVVGTHGVREPLCIVRGQSRHGRGSSCVTDQRHGLDVQPVAWPQRTARGMATTRHGLDVHPVAWPQRTSRGMATTTSLSSSSWCVYFMVRLSGFSGRSASSDARRSTRVRVPAPLQRHRAVGSRCLAQVHHLRVVARETRVRYRDY